MRNKKYVRRGGPLGPHADRKDGKPRGLAARIIRRRLLLGLSQERAAAVLGVHTTTLAMWELGREPRGLYRKAVDTWLKGQ